ncbi:hypothetical protein KC19_9G074700 [Ceratodon purpureus]|uniref:Uncharacterized protein n=1 Tax=Ceratodon purpureus TaxID=3225 RepID=A0A8T0GTT9_CERPU|nr:hypothetical protein KC19_9G074700 [Ceratodon purpureus]
MQPLPYSASPLTPPLHNPTYHRRFTAQHTQHTTAASQPNTPNIPPPLHSPTHHHHFTAQHTITASQPNAPPPLHSPTHHHHFTAQRTTTASQPNTLSLAHTLLGPLALNHRIPSHQAPLPP